MPGYILQRLSGMIAVMLLVVTIVFVIVRVTPGDPAAVMLGPEATAHDVRACGRVSDMASAARQLLLSDGAARPCSVAALTWQTAGTKAPT